MTFSLGRSTTPVSSPDRRGPYNKTRFFPLFALVIILAPKTSSAAPQTSISSSLHFTGSASGERFGATIDCSAPSTATQNSSLMAVGAPNAVSPSLGQQAGRVYIIDPSAAQGSRALQTIDSPSPQTGAEFGKALAFVNDFNNDSVPDLVIAQPHGTTGTLFLFHSQINQGSSTISYAPCGELSGDTYFAEVLTPLRSPSPGTPTILIGSPRASIPNTLGVSIQSSGTSCSTTQHPEFSFSGATSSLLGSGVSFIANTNGSFDGRPEMLVGISHQGGASNLSGSVQMAYSDPPLIPMQLDPMATPTVMATSTPPTSAGLIQLATGGETDLLGSSLAGSESSSVFAAGAPGALGGRGRVSLFNSAGSPLCAFSEGLESSSVGFGRTIVALGDSFGSLTGQSDTTLASYRSEDSTGGSVALFGMNSTNSSCSQSLVQVNNCVAQPTQEQGAALAGGAHCVLTHNGAPTVFLAVGAPGFDREAGRVDIYTELNAPVSPPQPCTAITAPGAAPDSSPSVLPAQATPITQPTAPNVPDPTPSNPSSPEPPSPDPSSGGANPGSPPPSTEGIEIFPGFTDLPEPKISTSSRGNVVANLPTVTPTLVGRGYSKALSQLLKAGFSKAQATKALKRVTTTYIITFQPLRETSALTKQKKSSPAASKASTKIRLRSRKNRISARLSPSTSYSVSYRVEFSITKPKRVTLGSTKESAPTRFRTMP